MLALRPLLPVMKDAKNVKTRAPSTMKTWIVQVSGCHICSNPSCGEDAASFHTPGKKFFKKSSMEVTSPGTSNFHVKFHYNISSRNKCKVSYSWRWTDVQCKHSMSSHCCNKIMIIYHIECLN
jgi:hypothetical protein